MPTKTKPPNPEIDRLAKVAARLTKRMTDCREDLAYERALIWDEALKLGATHRELADAAGLHHAQIAKAIARYVWPDGQ